MGNFFRNILNPVLSFPPDRLNLHRWFPICWTMRQFSDVQTLASLIYGLMRWLISRSLKPPFWFLARHQTYLFVFPRHQSVWSYLKLCVRGFNHLESELWQELPLRSHQRIIGYFFPKPLAAWIGKCWCLDFRADENQLSCFKVQVLFIQKFNNYVPG